MKRHRIRPRIIFFNRSYWPDVDATGQLLTNLCEGLAPTYDVTVIAGLPNKIVEEGKQVSTGQEKRHGVVIDRVWHTQFAKSSRLGRVLNYVSFLFTAFLSSFRHGTPDIIVVETDPPILCFLGEVLRSWHRCALVVYLQDIYPDVAVALGKLPRGRCVSLLRRLMYGIYRRADRVIVLSEDMRRTIESTKIEQRHLACIPNWVDTEVIKPMKAENRFRRKFQLEKNFVVMYSGNLGQCQPWMDLIEAAEYLQSTSRIKIILIGDGVSRPWLQAETQRRGLKNVQFIEFQPSSELSSSLSAADLHLVLIEPSVVNYLMPSKVYAILASGTPLVFVGPRECELARLVEQENIGIVTPTNDPKTLCAAILCAQHHLSELEDMGKRARALAVTRFDYRIALKQFITLFQQISEERLGSPYPASESHEQSSVRQPGYHEVPLGSGHHEQRMKEARGGP